MEPKTEIDLVLQNLRYQNQITKTEFFGKIGTTNDGLSVLFPDSLQRGYTAELTPISERPKMLWQILGLVGYFSDGNFNYLPSYNQGRDIARDIKTNLIAEQTWKLTQKDKEKDVKIQKLENTVESMKDEIDRLKKQSDKKKD